MNGWPTIYLAGAITGCTYAGCTDWREWMIEELAKSKIRGISPMRAKLYLLHETNIGDHYDKEILSCQKGIYHRDKWDALRCSGLFFNFLNLEKATVGSSIEFGWGTGRPDCPPIVVAVNQHKGNPQDHAMIREGAGFIVPDLEQAVTTIKAIFS